MPSSEDCSEGQTHARGAQKRGRCGGHHGRARYWRAFHCAPALRVAVRGDRADHREHGGDHLDGDDTADKGKLSVRYANGQVRTRRRALLVSSDPKPGPGSEVFVPVRDTTQHVNYVQLIGGIAQIVASTIAIIVVATK